MNSKPKKTKAISAQAPKGKGFQKIAYASKDNDKPTTNGVEGGRNVKGERKKAIAFSE